MNDKEFRRVIPKLWASRLLKAREQAKEHPSQPMPIGDTVWLPPPRDPGKKQ